jgi:hypothetical protein
MNLMDCLNVVFMCDKLNMPEEAKMMKEVITFNIKKLKENTENEKETKVEEVKTDNS